MTRYYRIRFRYHENTPPKYALGSNYGPLQTDGTDYLCPECGGYGWTQCGNVCCAFCGGSGILDMADSRITGDRPLDQVTA
jgi:hypothetical protein